VTASDWSFPRAEALPPYAFVVTDAVKARVRAAGADIIDLGLGNPDHAPQRAIIEQLHAAVDVPGNHRYHPGRGLLKLRQAMHDWYARRYHIDFDPEREIVITMGAKEGMAHLCLAILDRGDVAVVPDPCYPIHAFAPQIAGADVVFYPATTAIPVARAVADTIKKVEASGRRVKLVIANYPQNPSGQVLTREELADLVRVVGDSGAMLLHDLAYADLDFGSRFAPSIFDCGVDPERVRSFAVEVFSMSKSYDMPGWRLGYVCGNERMVTALSHVKTYVDYGTFAPLQHAAAWALTHGDPFVEEMRNLYQTRAKALVQGLRAAGWPDVAQPRGTMFVWAKIPPAFGGRRSLAAAIALLEQAHVAVSAGIGFGPGGDEFLRFALIEDPPRIQEACDRIAKFLRGG
jgi:alanine-synthesizing transaminase